MSMISSMLKIEEVRKDLARLNSDALNADLGGGADDFFLAAEVAVDRAGGHPGGRDHVVDRGGVEAVAREAAPRAGQDVPAALLAGLIAQTGHHTRLNENVSLRYGRPGCTLGSKKKEFFPFGGQRCL